MYVLPNLIRQVSMQILASALHYHGDVPSRAEPPGDARLDQADHCEQDTDQKEHGDHEPRSHDEQRALWHRGNDLIGWQP